ncbi:hypothetical protein [Hyphomonas sp.]|uniref:hypothetical protein n=1 Tax=Hyphomonas sp. TaxID=87 RepID=UPI0025C30B65|nr:hypothetical protein [Hyphomonas sp.]MBI1401454.1 hypothetical protein [Hyphomonas sp.]
MAFRAGARIDPRRALAKARRLPSRVAAEVRQATETNARSLARDAKIGAPLGATGALKASPEAEPVRGSLNTAWRATSGNSKAFYAHLVDGGTKPGRRVITRGKRRGQSFNHPGTRAVGFHRARYALKRAEYRKRMRKAYRDGARGR